MNQPKALRFAVEPLSWKEYDPLAAEYALIVKLANETMKTGWQYGDLQLEFTEAGQEILKLDLEGNARLALALAAQLAHYDDLGRKARSLTATEMERLNWHHSCPEWEAIWPARQVWAKTLRHIMRRKLPLGVEHLAKLAEWIAADDRAHDSLFPLKLFIKAVEASGEIVKGDAGLRSTLSRMAAAFRNSPYPDLPKLAHRIESVLGDTANAADEAEATGQVDAGPDPSIPAAAGSPQVLVRLKQFLGLAPDDDVTSVDVGLDQFALRADSPLRDEHETINMLLPELVGTPNYHSPDLSGTAVGRAMLNSSDEQRGRILLALAERCVNTSFARRIGLDNHEQWQSQYAIGSIFLKFLSLKPAPDRNSLFDVLLYVSAVGGYRRASVVELVGPLIQQAEDIAKSSPLIPGERHILHRIRSQSVRACPFGRPPPEVVRFNQLIGDNRFMALVPGEAWADAVNADLGKLPRSEREKWLKLLEHAASANGSRPSAKWLKTAGQNREAVGETKYLAALQKWFPLVNVPRAVRLLHGGALSGDTGGDGIHDDNATCLRGLLWMLPEALSQDIIRAIGDLTASCYRKIPGVGPRAVKVGNAGVYALSRIPGPLAVGQLALLKVKIKFGSAQKEIEKAFSAAAERSGLPREELEEMSVPAYGLTDVGICEEQMGEFTARLTVTGTTSTELEWVKADGKVQKGVPAALKESHKEELQELKAAAKDIQRMLPAQRERIDGLFLQQKTWPLAAWRERYLNHPLVGTLARRILWEFRRADKVTAGMWLDGRIVDRDLNPVEAVDGQTSVQLWHPIGKSTEEVLGWRERLEAHQIQQPFKQAHREIYVLTDAERNTRVYSNRYAAHILRQHQFNALCALRGWKNQLRLMVDAAYGPPTLHLPQWGLRAEFWVEGAGTDYGTDTNDSGVYNHVATDQVRFYRVDAAQRTAHAHGGGYRPAIRAAEAEPVPLEEIPPLVFSEVMRDVDLFVGVASVGNDPAWQDGGPNGRYVDYWREYSWGELNASAKTRKEVLERLVPKLKIANRCSFNDRFLVVKGSLRTYRIHLGSGNIMMEPNDQYLCIVPRQGEAGGDEGVILPFEGDRTLSIIISKAFMLADDAKIKDSSILSQIRR